MPLMVVYAAVAFFVSNYLSINNWFSLIMSIVVYALGYTLVAWFVLFNQSEKGLVLGFLHRRRV